MVCNKKCDAVASLQKGRVLCLFIKFNVRNWYHFVLKLSSNYLRNFVNMDAQAPPQIHEPISQGWTESFSVLVFFLLYQVLCIWPYLIILDSLLLYIRASLLISSCYWTLSAVAQILLPAHTFQLLFYFSSWFKCSDLLLHQSVKMLQEQFSTNFAIMLFAAACG